jgi:hypothetical protein
MQLDVHRMLIDPERASAAALPLQWAASPVVAR